MKTRRVAIMLLVLGLTAALAAQAQLEPTALRCEYLSQALGVDVPHPRLSWVLESNQRAQRQTAYRILVASGPALLDKDQGDLWDSGKVEASQQNQIAYAGQPLVSHQVCHWKVRAWDQDGNPGPWSAPAAWTMGLLDPADWHAEWISAPYLSQNALPECSWVWYPEEMPGPCTRWFRKAVELDETPKIERVTMTLTADNGFRLFVNGGLVARGTQYESLYTLDITARLESGVNIVGIEAANAGESPNPAGLVGQIDIALADGNRKVIPIDASWKASNELKKGWLAKNFDDSAWPSAKVLGPMGMDPWGSPAAPKALPLFRREFEARKNVRRATAYVCGLGFYEMSVNGQPVSDFVFEPGWTNYRKTCQYRAYDVTPLLKQGENALGIMLGNGMYNVPGGRYVKFTGTFGPPKLIMHLRLEYADGTAVEVVSDGAWKTAQGPIRFSCIFGGEDYDACAELPGWDQPGFDDTAWQAAEGIEGPGGRLTSQTAPPIKVMDTFETAAITEPKPGVFVFDLGQNFSGRPWLKVKGPRGAAVKLTPGELLDDQGLVSQRSSGGPMWFTYTLKGDGIEEWSPRFSYYGFRYVQVEGAVPADSDSAKDGLPEVVQLAGQFTHSSATPVGAFTCANPLVNDIHALILAAIKSNLQSVLTDCPHREKLGWLEVSQLLFDGISYNFDAARFYAKVENDIRDSQLDNGFVPDIAPEYTVFHAGFRDSPEWGSASIINPWRVYEMYGDTRILETHYPVMKAYADYLGSTANDNIVSHGLGDWYDIGPNRPGESQLTSKGVTATAVYYQDLAILERVARILGKPEEAEAFRERAEATRQAFNATYYRPEEHCYDRNSQTANAMPLILGLAEDDWRSGIVENLVNGIREGGYRVTAGDVGFSYLVHALSENGHGSTLYRMVCQTGGPGYAYQLSQGATSLTEAWDSGPASSQNHCMLGHAEGWLYRGLAGIQPDAEHPGFAQFTLRPEIPEGLEWVRAHYDSVRGRIVSEWGVDGAKLIWNIRIPPNTTATLYVPAVAPNVVTESSQPAAEAGGLTFLRMEGGCAVYEAASGHYHFMSRMAR